MTLDDKIIDWQHTAPCIRCQGRHTEYATRKMPNPCCGCRSLLERLPEGKPKRKDILAQRDKRVLYYKDHGYAIKEIAAAMEITTDMVVAATRRLKGRGVIV